MLLSGVYQAFPDSGALQRWINRQHAQVGAFPGRLDIYATRKCAVMLRDKEGALCETSPDLIEADAIVVEKETLYLKGGVDEAGDSFGVAGFGDAELRIRTLSQFPRACRRDASEPLAES